MPPQVRLYRDPEHGKIGGVCAGVAEVFGWDVTLLRLAWAISVVFAGFGFILYLICWFVMPTKAQVLAEPKPAGPPASPGP